MTEKSARFPARPIVGVGAVVFDGDRVLLVQRGHPPLMGAWSLPGGRVETGEALRDAVVRELREETGIDVEVGPLVEVVDRIHLTAQGTVEYHFVVVDYLCEPLTRSLAEGSDAADARWVAWTDLAQYGVSETAIEVIRKARDMRRDRALRPPSHPL